MSIVAHAQFVAVCLLEGGFVRWEWSWPLRWLRVMLDYSIIESHTSANVDVVECLLPPATAADVADWPNERVLSKRGEVERATRVE